MKIKYTKNCTKIYDSYLLKTNEDIHSIVAEIIINRSERNMSSKRKWASYAREIKAHNRLYKLGLFRSHTKDTDLEENIKKWKEVIFKIIGR